MVRLGGAQFGVILLVSASLVSRNASATAIVLCVEKDGIVLTADSKQLVESKESRTPVQKIVRVGPKTFLASSGPRRMTADSVTSDGKPWVYDFAVLADHIARSTKGADTTSVADAVWREAKSLFGPVGADMAELHQQILFVIVGVDADAPHAWEVKVWPTPTDLRVEKELIPAPELGQRCIGNGFARGDLESPATLIDEAHRRAEQLFTPQADFEDRIIYAGLLVALRAEHSPKTVGPPIRQVILARGGRVVERTWTDKLLRSRKRILGSERPRVQP